MPPPELKVHPANSHPLPPLPPAVGGEQPRRQRATSRPHALDDQPIRRAKSRIEITKFAEGEDDEDFSDILGPNDTLTEKEESDRASEDGGIMLLSKLSNNSWLGDDEDEEDPFAMMDPEYNELDLEANIARDRHARLAERVEEAVHLLKIGTEISGGEERISDVAEDLYDMLHENDEVKNLIIAAHGLLPLLELLTLPSGNVSTAKSRQQMILLLLRVINKVQITVSFIQFIQALY